jgi:hypothetical protein
MRKHILTSILGLLTFVGFGQYTLFSVNYYRLTQVDFNGVYETFDIISINNSRKQKQILKITNTLGQEVSKDTKGLLIITYTDGTSEKIMN